jgi:hypothetical protein
MLKDRRRSGDLARSTDFLGGAWWPGISLTEAVDEELEWMGVEATEEWREADPRTKLGMRRPGISSIGSYEAVRWWQRWDRWVQVKEPNIFS